MSTAFSSAGLSTIGVDLLDRADKMALVRIPCTIEWIGHRAGWRATAEFRGQPITVSQASSFALARRRLQRALEQAGASAPELEVQARMPKQIETDLDRYRELVVQLPGLQAELEALKLRLAQRLSGELNFSEREVGIWLGVSGAHISARLRANTVDTGEYSRDDVPKSSRPGR